MATSTRIVGIDPGSHNLGFSCLTKSGNQLKLLTAETVQAPRKAELYDRLNVIRLRLVALFDEFSPDEVAIENIFTAKNVQSAFYLGIVRGVIFTLCMERGIRVFEYAPTQVKSVVTGSGRADKTQVQKMVGLILGAKVDAGFDATDAVAIAICHANTNRFAEKLSC